jgi:adenine-specific DNA-methyltransferase
MKSKVGLEKLRGGYYTPEPIAQFICDWAIDINTKSILEPSCGDGVFLKEAVKKVMDINPDANTEHMIVGVELFEEEAKKASIYGAKVVAGDFFGYYKDHIEGEKKFDVIVGNPPFIRYQNVDADSRETAFQLMRGAGLHPNKLTNIWLPFLVLSALALSKNGKLGMVIPAELFQVSYAGETREFLAKFFDRLTLITFQKIVFQDIQQEVVLLLGEKTSNRKGIQVIELNDLEDLSNLDLANFYDYEVKELNHSDEKWIKYFLSCEEIELMRKLRNNVGIVPTTDLFEINVGLVSGENSFFLMNHEMVKEYQLGNATRMIIGKTEQLKGVILSERDFENLVDKGKKVYMFAPQNVPFSELSKEEQEYIKYGEKLGFNRGYKCRIRKNWYCVPQSWEPDAFILRQVNRYPRIILNYANAVSTDTIHKIRFLDGVNPEYVAAAFLNSFTLALAEVTGRSYGGGVLTFEPSEIRKLMIPMKNAELLDVKKIDKLIREHNIEEVLNCSDKILLVNGLGLSGNEVKMLRNIWLKLSERRLGRKEKSA